MQLLEMHFHTSESSPCGKTEARRGIAMYARAGYDGIVVTDHFSRSVCGPRGEKSWEQVVKGFLKGFYEAKKAGEKEGVRVYLGMELRFPDNENDFLVYGLEERFLYDHPWIYEMRLEQASSAIRSFGLVVVQAHPFRSSCTPADPEYLDGAEVINKNARHDSHNALALAWAREHGLLKTAGSDFHRPEDLSGAGIRVERLPEDEKQLAQILKNGNYILAEDFSTILQE